MPQRQPTANQQASGNARTFGITWSEAFNALFLKY
jgi:hypothetical protein